MALDYDVNLVVDNWRGKTFGLRLNKTMRTSIRRLYQRAFRKMLKLTPENTGNLIGSADFVYKKGAFTDAMVIELGTSMKYNVPYDSEVHDGPQKNWKKAGASNKFAEIPIAEADAQVDAIVGRVVEKL